MSTKQELAISYFNNGFNCSQAVLSVFCENYGMDKETAFKAACGFGGGVRLGEICGAVSGAVLVIGLKYGQYIAEDSETKGYCYSKTVEFLNAFKLKNQTVVCREILGYDISKKDEYEQALNQNLFKTTCVDMVKSAVLLLEELGY